MKADISEKGEVRGAWMVSGLDQQTNRKILEAVKRWKFDPATKDGKPVRLLVLVEFNYSEDGKIAKSGDPKNPMTLLPC